MEVNMENENNSYENEFEKEPVQSSVPAPLGEQNNEIGVTEYYPEGTSSYEKKEGVRYDEIFDKGKPKTLAFSIVSLVTGILSIICCCTVWLSLPFGVISIIFAVVSRKVLGYFDGMAIAGLILGIFGTVLGIMLIVFTLGPLSQMIDEIMKEMEAGTGAPPDL